MNTTLTSKTMTRNSLAAAIAIAIALTVPSIAQAAAKAWTCTNSYWDYASCWSSSGVPSSADNVYVGAVSGGDSVLKIDGYTGNAYANGLTVDSTIATPTVQQTGGALSISVGGIGERIGYSGTGAYSQTGGTHTVSGYLEMGWYAGSHGAYSLSGGTLNLQGDPSSDSLIVANYGTADFNQSGGAVNVGNTLVAGTRSGGAGTYELGGAGSLTAGQEFIGRSGTGTFTQNGGTHIVSGQLTLGSNIYGQATYGTGRYYLNGGALSADSEVIGEQGVGQLAQNGGTNTVAGDLMLGGGDPNLPGTYQLYGGTLTVHGNIVTGSGHSTLEVDSGTLNVDGNIDVVNFTVGGPGRVGSYTLSGSRSLNATYENIGEYLSGYSGGHGTMSQTGGTNSGNFLNLGLGGGGAVGAYHLSGTGVVSMESEFLGAGGSGTFVQDGGSNTMSQGLYVGGDSSFYPTGTGSYELRGGAVSAGFELVGDSDVGSFVQSAGSNHVTSGELQIGVHAGGNGTYTLSGTGELGAYRETIGGAGGAGRFTQTGGTNTVDSTLSVAGSSASYELRAGSLSADTMFNLGTFTQTGGTNTLGNYLNLQFGGQYLLQAGDLLAHDEYIALSTTTALVQSGGTNTIDRWLQVESGRYELSGAGVLSAYYEYIGHGGTGLFEQSGGTNSTHSWIYVGSAGGTGHYVLSGTGVLTPDTITIGYDGTGLFTQTGGTNSTLVMTLAAKAGSNGRYDLSAGGDLSTDYETVGYMGTGQFRQSGGSHTVNTRLTIGADTAGGTGDYELQGGRLSADTIRLFAGSTFHQTGGTLTYNTFNQNGGTVSSDRLNNGGTFNYSGGVFSGRLINNGTVNFDADFTAGNGMENNTSFTVASGRTVTLNGAGLNNNGAVHLTGGTLAGAGPMENNGEIDGHGTLGGSGGLTNHGTVNLAHGLTTVVGDVVNTSAGHVQVTDAPAVFTGNVVNNGTFESTNASVIFNGGYTENGAFISDPSNNYFTDVTIGANGYWVGGAGDNFFVSGNFVNNSTRSTLWNTSAAGLFLNGAGSQDLYLAGSDLGAVQAGYNDNFAWGSFDLSAGESLHLLDGNSDPTAALYVHAFELGGGLSQISSIYSDYNIYYDPNAAGSAYLGGLTYALNGSGFLKPAAVPVPPAVWLFGSGLLGLGVSARRKVA